MPRSKKSAIWVTGIFRVGFVGVNTDNSKLTDPVQLAKSIGIDENNAVKAKITIEVMEEPCAFCGKLITGDHKCQKCGFERLNKVQKEDDMEEVLKISVSKN